MVCSRGHFPAECLEMARLNLEVSVSLRCNANRPHYRQAGPQKGVPFSRRSTVIEAVFLHGTQWTERRDSETQLAVGTRGDGSAREGTVCCRNLWLRKSVWPTLEMLHEMPNFLRGG